MSEKAYSPGLEGVIAGESALAHIDAERNRLILRGYDLVELTERACYEEVAYLLLWGDLPTRAELERFRGELGQARQVPAAVLDLLREAPKDTPMMALLRTAASALALHDGEAGDNSRPANLRKAVRLLARIPTLLTAAYRLSQGQEPVAPLKEEPGQAASLLYMLRGQKPSAYEVKALDASLIAYAEHGYNASTFTARVVASTLSDLYAATTAAIGALAGPLHGGANEAAMEMLLEIGDKDQAESWVLEALAQKKKIMGFGHREYKKGDSRVPAVKKAALEVARQVGDHRWLEIGERVEQTMIRQKGIHPNLDFPTSYLYYMMGIPIPLYTPIFVSSRVAGWAAHVIEQHEHNRLIRPHHLYTGPEGRPFKPIEQRG
jgi:citrate synthase